MNYYGNSSPNDYWNYLAHYGVKGMKWRNRKNPYSNGRTSNERGDGSIKTASYNRNKRTAILYGKHIAQRMSKYPNMPYTGNSRNARFRTETGVPNSSHKVQTNRFNGNTRNARFRENMGMDQPFNKYARNTRSAQETSSGGSIKNTYKTATDIDNKISNIIIKRDIHFLRRIFL